MSVASHEDGLNPTAHLSNIAAPRETSSSPTEPQHELPLLEPLSHSHPLLSASSQIPFDVDEFLLSRSHTSLPDLRSELRDYLAELKSELVQLINDDYAAFISLRTDLRGEGPRIEKLVRPLMGVLKDIEVCNFQLRLYFGRD